jgi:hypothetical protein
VAGLALGLASLEDLVAMKLAAIRGRSAAKDFWDLDEMLHAGVCGGDPPHQSAGASSWFQRACSLC